MGEPLTLRTPLPVLTAATATEFFFLPKHWTSWTCLSDIVVNNIRIILIKSYTYNRIAHSRSDYFNSFNFTNTHQKSTPHHGKYSSAFQQLIN